MFCFRMHQVFKCILAAGAVISVSAQTGSWSYVQQDNTPIAREECSFVAAGNKFYLVGGRGVSPVNEFDPDANLWINLSQTPMEMNHFEAVEVYGLVYVICAFYGGYPHEVPVPNIYIFDPREDHWVTGPEIPADRQRGSAGVVMHNDKLYISLGIQDGHSAGWVPWLDEYDPFTNTWRALQDAPRERDHFNAAATGTTLYALGGRRSNWPSDIFAELEKSDIYDFSSGEWSTLPSPEGDLPIPRSGAVVVNLGTDIIFAGGGSRSNGSDAHSETHALSTLDHTWRLLAPLNTGRQVTGGFVNNSGIYIAGGSGGSGGSPQLQTMEVFFMSNPFAPAGDPLTAGEVTGRNGAFNAGIVPAGQQRAAVFNLVHSSGNQAVLLTGLTLSGSTAFAVTSSHNFPLLIKPGQAFPVEITFTSASADPADATLTAEFAIPDGATTPVPVEANRSEVSVSGPDVRALDLAIALDVQGKTLSLGRFQFQAGEKYTAAVHTPDGRQIYKKTLNTAAGQAVLKPGTALSAKGAYLLVLESKHDLMRQRFGI